MEIDRDAVLRAFFEESLEGLEEMEGALVLMETQPEDTEIVETIFRVAHTLKGNASILDFPQLGQFAHTLEEVLERLRSGTLAVDRGLVTLLLKTVDALRQIVPDAVAGDDSLAPDQVALMAVLAQVGSSGETDSGAVTRSAPVENKRRRLVGRRRENVRDWLDRKTTLRVDIEKLDQLLNLTGELSIARARMTELLETGGELGEGEVLEAHRSSGRLYLDLQEQVMRVRMVPVGPMFRQYVRTVRDVATTQEKSARLVLRGEDVELDTTVIESIRDPLTHMIRNAVDHGIELPAVREERGKDPCGCITLSAQHEAGSIVIQLSDDGDGLDRERILEVARSRGIVDDQEHLSEQETYELIFRPGFTTSATVTEVSGRGVGMDVVRRNVEVLQGTLEIESEKAKGVTMRIRLPLTLAIVEGFSVGVNAETYVLPLDAVVECLELPRKETRYNALSGVIDLRGDPLPYVRLRHLFQLDGTAPSRESVVVVQSGESRTGVVVDRLLGEAQQVIKPLGKLFKDLSLVSGSTVLGSGKVALILDVPGLSAASNGTESQRTA